MTVKIEKLALVFLLSCLFLTGYYLRAYFSIYEALPYSPYDAYLASADKVFSIDSSQLDIFNQKLFNYPLSYLVNSVLGFSSWIYWVYIFGALVIFWFGKVFSGSIKGGLIAFAFFAVSSENLLQYTSTVSHAGLSYLLIWSALLSLFVYFKKAKDLYLLLFVIASVLATITYHTGAVALSTITACFLLVIIFKEKKISTKLLFALLVTLTFSAYWLLFFDVYELFIVTEAFSEISPFHLLLAVILSTLTWSYWRFFSNLKFLSSPYIVAVATIVAAILIVLPIDIFYPLLTLGVPNYFSSAVTLNNYIAQALLLHIYLLTCLPYLKQDDAQKRFAMAWTIGLVVVALGLFLEQYYARIFDYSFPLMFILAGYYWSRQKELRKTLVAAGVILLIISQLMIYKDPFSMRRYYTKDEMTAAQKVIEQGIKGYSVTDLRTAALFNYLGATAVELPGSRAYQSIFYEPEAFSEAQMRGRSEIYVILSKSMEKIMYGLNFETTPLPSEIFEYYRNNYPLIYQNELMSIYRIRP